MGVLEYGREKGGGMGGCEREIGEKKKRKKRKEERGGRERGGREGRVEGEGGVGVGGGV